MSAVQADTTPIGSRPYLHSIDLNHHYKDKTADSMPTSAMSPSTTHVLSTPPKLHSSFSAGEIPTVKTMSAAGLSSANAHAQQHFHNHKAGTA
ncbi:hypothetical protein FHL15_006465 [Xylaria flabelliformis]|uniref:Uncharacterized protein n=1 Tax=Xylaria flabelliformis TaxID=2512241 RepID=A0A553HX61_9PEZI|nr:hypothetical protein FHL15_006465 [Xylaria flabelliformis]